MATPAYRYLLCDLLTDRVIAAPPLKGVSFDRRISRTGTLSGKLEVADANGARVAKLLRDNAGRSALWVFRDNALWWGGIPWTVIPARGKRGTIGVDISAATFDSYAFHRRISQDLAYVNMDQGVLFPELWRQLQSETSGDIGVDAIDQPMGFPSVDFTYKVADHAYVGDVLQALGDADVGPEHTIDVYVTNGGVRVKRLRVGRQLGLAEPRHVFTAAEAGGGTVTEWSHASDAANGGTRFQTRGDGVLSTVVERTDLLAEGWPLLDVVEDFSGVTSATDLNATAQALAATRGGTAMVSNYTVEVGSTGWNPNNVGDAVRLRLFDAFHGAYDEVVRPVACQVTAADAQTPESVQLILTEDGS